MSGVATQLIAEHLNVLAVQTFHGGLGLGDLADQPRCAAFECRLTLVRSLRPRRAAGRRRDRQPPLVTLHDKRIDVGRPRHRGGVAELLGDLLHHRRFHAFDGRLVDRRIGVDERRSSENRSVPRAQILDGVLLADEFLEPRIEILGV